MSVRLYLRDLTSDSSVLKKSFPKIWQIRKIKFIFVRQNKKAHDLNCKSYQVYKQQSPQWRSAEGQGLACTKVSYKFALLQAPPVSRGFFIFYPAAYAFHKPAASFRIC